MSRSQSVFGWLDDKSDWLSPIVVKEVRQIVRGQDFAYAFTASLVGGLAFAFFGAADALTGNPTSGNWTFVALMGCLSLLGLAIVPLGAFSALRNERMEQTLELITLTALSPRRVVVGKLLAHGVKLVTLFSAVAPFIAMSFLLGGVDFISILVALVGLFLWSMWAIAACLFLSCLFRTRAMSGLVFGGAGILLFLVFGAGRMLFFAGVRTTFAGVPVAGGTAQYWWSLAIAASACLATMLNLVLLAENRLSLAAEPRVAPLRVGFLLQFLVIAAWTLSFLGEPANTRAAAANVLGALGGWHLALVATFTVTESLQPQRERPVATVSSSFGRLLSPLAPGGGRGALYVLAQMAALVVAGWLLSRSAFHLRWLLAICAYVGFFSGVPTLVARWLRPHAPSLHLRVAVLVLLSIAMLLPDLVYYLLWRPKIVGLGFSERHLLNPLRTLSNWQVVEVNGWFAVPFALGLAGLVAYVLLMIMAARMAAHPVAEPRDSDAATGEADGAKALY